MKKNFNQFQAKWLKLSLIVYFLALTFVSDIPSGYFVKKRLGIQEACTKKIRVAIIDNSFDLSQLPKENIISPLNVSRNNADLAQIPTFDNYGNVQFSNHGTSIVNLFIGKHGLLKNAQIIPIQITSAADLEKALTHATWHKAQIISISLSFAQNYAPLPLIAKLNLLKASEDASILIAAGNDSLALEDFIYGKSMINLAQQSKGRIWLIGATKFTLMGEQRAEFSNYARAEGKRYMLWAPGQNITLDEPIKQMFTQGISGTSIATPLMAIKMIYHRCTTNKS